MYKLIWKGEEIDSTDCIDDAYYLQGEYNMAFRGSVTIEGI